MKPPEWQSYGRKWFILEQEDSKKTFSKKERKETNRNFDVFDYIKGDMISVGEFRNELSKVTKKKILPVKNKYVINLRKTKEIV